MPVPARLILTVVVAVAWLSPAAAQLKSTTEARYVGGFHPQACRYPPSARKAGLSGCCQMDLDIGAKGEVLKADGVCSDPIFLEPTRLCLTVQQFVPATRNGQPVRGMHHLEYEWRSTVPSDKNLCQKLKTS
jgi:hypothetical protein